MLPIDPQADPCRRAWVPCPACTTDCADCASSRNCAVHWAYLLANRGPVVNLQCRGCGCVWAVDTRAKRYLGEARA